MFTYLLTAPAKDFINVINQELIKRKITQNTFRGIDFSVSGGEVFASLGFNPNDQTTETKVSKSNIRVEFFVGKDKSSLEGDLNVFLKKLETQTHLLETKVAFESGTYYVLVAYQK